MNDKVEEYYKEWAEENNVSYFSYETCKEAYEAGYSKANSSFLYSWELK